MMGLDGGRRMFDRETSKPRNLFGTLGRFAQYFRSHWFGFVIAITLSVYFFTYAMLTDKGLHRLLWFQAISTVVMVFMLIKLKSISFFCARILLGRRAKYREVLASMTLADLAGHTNIKIIE